MKSVVELLFFFVGVVIVLYGVLGDMIDVGVLVFEVFVVVGFGVFEFGVEVVEMCELEYEVYWEEECVGFGNVFIGYGIMVGFVMG